MTPKKFAKSVKLRLIDDKAKRNFIHDFSVFCWVTPTERKNWCKNMDEFFDVKLLDILEDMEYVDYEAIDDMVCNAYKTQFDVPVIIVPLREALKDKRLYWITNEEHQSLAFVDSISSISFQTADALPMKTFVVGQIWTMDGVKQVEMAVGDLRALTKENVYDPNTKEHLYYSDIYSYDYLSIGGDENFDESEVFCGNEYEILEKENLMRKILYKVFTPSVVENICDKYGKEIVSGINGTITPYKVYNKISEIIGNKLI